MEDYQITTENENQVNPERIVERMNRIFYRLSINIAEVDNGIERASASLN